MITAQSDQITRFLARIDDGNYDSPDANATQVVFGGALELDREQEDRMCDWAFDELDNLMDDLGHPGHGGYQDDNASIADLNTFFGKRRLYELMYHKRVAWRKFGFGGIFAVSNLHLPIIRRIIQQQIARAMNYFFGTEPFFSASPQGQEDEIKASQINRYAQWKFRKAEVRQTYEAAVEKAMIRGEAVIKTTYERRSRFYEDFLTVAIDPKTKEPLLANDGDYIQQDDAIVPAINPETNEPEMQEDGVTPIMVLERDPTTEMPTGEMTWLTGKFTRERVTFEGPRADLVYYLDYLCAETAESAEAAPMVAHLYEIPATQITQAYLDRDSETGADNSEKPKILELLREAAGLRAEQRIAADGSRAEDGTDASGRRNRGKEGMIAVAECYLTLDVNDDGRPEEVMLILDLDSRRPIFYDYTDRVTPKGERPFYPVRVNPVDGRWYGNSQVDLFWDLQEFIDLTMNRWNVSQSEAGKVVTWNPDVVFEGDNNPHLVMNAKKTYRTKPGKTIDDLVSVKYLYDVKGDDLQAQIEFFMQLATTMSGVSTANDANMAGLDTTKLATGIKNLEKSGQELFAPLLSHLEPGFARASVALLRLLAAKINQAEVFHFFDGKVQIQQWMTPAELRGLDFIVEMELTRYKNEQELQQCLAALDLVDRYLAEIPVKQALVAPMYRKLFKAFGFDNSENILSSGLYLPPGGVGTDPETAAKAVEAKPTGKSEPNL